MSRAGSSVLIMTPTYNERENLPRLVREIAQLGLDCQILVIDDNSPDHTGDVAETLKSEHPNLIVHHRPGKLGIGSAHLDAIRFAYREGYKQLLTLDCDFTHSPSYIPKFLREADEYALVIANRYLNRESLAEWPLRRRFLTKLAHFLTLLILGIPFDATTAFRCYNLERVRPEVFDRIRSHGYAFFFESLYWLWNHGVSVIEIPIHLPARTLGRSKMTSREIMASVSMLVAMLALRLNGLLRSSMHRRVSNEVSTSSKTWDDYWRANRSPSFYSLAARFYRRRLIGSQLRRFVKKYFTSIQDPILHAGCGSGEVDESIQDLIRPFSLDLAWRALELNAKISGNHRRLCCGDLFKLPFTDNSLGGIYNLGVMEHFYEPEIQEVLSEFRRCLKTGGLLMLFWPPEYGVSVRFLNTLHFVLNSILKRGIRLHPEEVGLLRSRAHAEEILKRAGFRLVEYYFGPMDFFTQVALIAEKH